MLGWLVVGLFGIIYILMLNAENKRLSYLFKPLTLLSLFAVLIASGRDQSQFLWVAIGLILCLISDVIFIRSPNKTKARLTFLIIGLLSYSKAFWSQSSQELTWWLPALLVAGGIILFLLFLPKLDTVIFPVSIMGVVLIQMTWAAISVWLVEPSIAHLYACLACLGFFAVNFTQALNNHRLPAIRTDIWTSAVYVVSQCFIVASVVA